MTTSNCAVGATSVRSGRVLTNRGMPRASAAPSTIIVSAIAHALSVAALRRGATVSKLISSSDSRLKDVSTTTAS